MKLREWRENNNLTQYELAEILGVAQPTVSQWENGEYLPDNAMRHKLRQLSSGRIEFSYETAKPKAEQAKAPAKQTEAPATEAPAKQAGANDKQKKEYKAMATDINKEITATEKEIIEATRNNPLLLATILLMIQAVRK